MVAVYYECDWKNTGRNDRRIKAKNKGERPEKATRQIDSR